MTVALLLAAMPASATTRYVWSGGSETAPYTNWATAAKRVHLAVNLSQDGDLVLVTNGTYLMNASVVITNAVTVRSVNGRAVTFFNANAARRAFQVDHPGGVLDGLTITNGYNGGGGGAGLLMSAGTVKHCRIGKSNAPSGGGGVRMTGGMLTNCLVDANRAPNFGDGGGLYLAGGQVIDCIVTGNESGTNTTAYGGGIFMTGGTMYNTVVVSNRSWIRGGGLYLQTTGVAMTNVLVVRNRAEGNGGGVAVINVKPRLVNCTIVSNEAGVQGGGIWHDQAGAQVGLTNGIVWYNTAPTGPEVYGISGTFLPGWSCAPSPVVTHGVNGNITNAPRFVSRATQDYRLQAGSPCINAGTNLTGLLAATDLDGYTRMVFLRVDLGAYESRYAGSGTIFCFL